MSNNNIICPNCKGKLQYSEQKRVYECPYCGYGEPVIESDQVQIEKIRMEHEFNKEQLHIQESIREEKKEKIKEFKRSKFSKVIIVFDVICALLMMSSFSDGHILKGLVALIQVAVFTTAWLSGAGIVKEKFDGMHTVLAIAGFILIIPFSMVPDHIRHKSSADYSAVVREELPELDKATEENVVDEADTRVEEEVAKVDVKDGEEILENDDSNKEENLLEETENNTEDGKDDNTDEVALVDGMRPEFKESMDSYEAFFDEYIAFMKKYSENPNNVVSMLGEYTKFMTKYTEAMEKMDAIGEEELNAEELKYYIDVTGRINKKLVDVMQ